MFCWLQRFYIFSAFSLKFTKYFLDPRTFFLIAGQSVDKNRHFWSPPPSSCPRSYWMAPYLDFNFAGLSSFHHVRWDKLLGPPGPGLQSTLDKVTDTTKAVKIMQNTFIFVRLSLYKGVSVVKTLYVWFWTSNKKLWKFEFSFPVTLCLPF